MDTVVVHDWCLSYPDMGTTVSASRQELKPVVEHLLELLGVRMTKSGQVTLHFDGQGEYTRAEVNYFVVPAPDLPGRRQRDTPCGK